MDVLQQVFAMSTVELVRSRQAGERLAQLRGRFAVEAVLIRGGADVVDGVAPRGWLGEAHAQVVAGARAL